MTERRIMLLADINSSHTRKWAEALSGRGIKTGIFSLRKCEDEWPGQDQQIVICSEQGISGKTFHDNAIKKTAYLKLLPSLKKAIRTFQPDILHAHYATSYGLLGRLSGFHPFIISCWGSDVMDFPQKGFLQKRLLKGNLNKADRILATSHTIESYIHRVIEREVIVTPFGVDTELFKPGPSEIVFEKNALVIGTIKSLEKVYCIDLLIEAFSIIQKKITNARLLIVGEGTERKKLEELCRKLGMNDLVKFTGRIGHYEVPKYHNCIDIFVNISKYESFGVSVLEAMACGKPVIVTNTGGLAEIVNDDSIGFKIDPGDRTALAEKMIKLSDPSLRKTIGENARRSVMERFEWKKNVELMVSIYRSITNKK